MRIWIVGPSGYKSRTPAFEFARTPAHGAARLDPVFRLFVLMRVHDLVPNEAYLSASRVSPLTVLTPAKPRLILARIVRIKIDVQVRYSAISKLEDVAETAARSFAPCPRLTRHSAL